MKTGATQILGKTINSVIVRERKECDPRCQLLIGFTDNTYFEFYCQDSLIAQTTGLLRGNLMAEPSGDGKNRFVAYDPEL